jgi:hypothetical protein
MESSNNATSTDGTKKISTTSETGHNKNVANFNTAYQILEEMDTVYNPSNDNIKLAILDPLRNELKVCIKELNEKDPIYKNDVADRELAIEPLAKLMTRIINNVKSLDIAAANKENIINLATKIRGNKSTKAKKTEKNEDDSISTSQMSYDSRIANLAALIALLAATPKYAPNETELKIITLEANHTSLEAGSKAVNASGAALLTARKNRNKILYHNPNNIIQIMKSIKSYLVGMGDEGKPYYKAIVKLKFTDLKK